MVYGDVNRQNTPVASTCCLAIVESCAQAQITSSCSSPRDKSRQTSTAHSHPSIFNTTPRMSLGKGFVTPHDSGYYSLYKLLGTSFLFKFLFLFKLYVLMQNDSIQMHSILYPHDNVCVCGM